MAKVLVSLNDRLLERIDQAAKSRGMSRSALISEWAARELGEPLGPGARPEVHAAIERLQALLGKVDDPEDSTAVIRAMRDSR
jgi:hypothetical protein